MSENYEKFLNRITELELDLSETVSANSRLTQDLQSLRELHEETVVAYGRLKNQHTTTKRSLHDERARSDVVEKQYTQQLAAFHEKMLSKAKELEELQQIAEPEKEIEMIRLKLSQELEQPFSQKISLMEKKNELESRKLSDAKRQIEVLRLELNQKTKELGQIEKDCQTRITLHDDLCQKKITSLQADLQKSTNLASTATNLRQQLYERAQRNKALMQEMESLEHRYKTEVDKLRSSAMVTQSEITNTRKKVRDLENDFEDSKRQCSDLQLRNTELEGEIEKLQKKSDAIDAITNSQRDLEKSKSDLTIRIRLLENQTELLEKELRLKNEELICANNKYEELSNEKADLEITTGRENTRIIRKDGTMDTMQSLKALQEKLRLEQNASGHNESYENKIKSLSEEINQLKAINETESVRLRQIESEKKVLKQECDSLHNSNNDLRRKNTDIMMKNSQLETKVSDLTTKLEMYQNDYQITCQNNQLQSDDLDKQLESVRATLRQTQKQRDSKEKELRKITEKRAQLAASSKKRLEAQRAKTKLLLTRYAELASQKEQAIKIAEANKQKYELNMREIHKFLSDSALAGSSQNGKRPIKSGTDAVQQLLDIENQGYLLDKEKSETLQQN